MGLGLETGNEFASAEVRREGAKIWAIISSGMKTKYATTAVM
jgi:hypothetical protein